MGAFLDKPLTDKSYESQEGNGLKSYSCSMQGWRITMEVIIFDCTYSSGFSRYGP